MKAGLGSAYDASAEWPNGLDQPLRVAGAQQRLFAADAWWGEGPLGMESRPSFPVAPRGCPIAWKNPTQFSGADVFLRLRARLGVYDEHGTGDLDKIMRHKSRRQIGQIPLKEYLKIHIFDVPCGYEEELVGYTLHRERVDKIGIFGHDNGLFPERKRVSIWVVMTPCQDRV
jgi:hypothetical protein